MSSYPGGKGGAGVWQRIISLMPRHQRYYELYLGHSPIFRRKRPAALASIGVDIDPAVIQWWRSPHVESGERARSADPAMLDPATPIPTIPGTTVIHGDALRILASDPAMVDATTLVYLDPPYMRRQRTRSLYDFEFESVQEHTALLNLITRLPCMVMLSGYSDPLYAAMLQDRHGWRVCSFPAMTRGGVRIEHVWMNFPEPAELHDCRWAGDGFRERERIKRKRQRWAARLAKLGAVERQIIREALELDTPQPAMLPAATS